MTVLNIPIYSKSWYIAQGVTPSQVVTPAERAERAAIFRTQHPATPLLFPPQTHDISLSR